MEDIQVIVFTLNGLKCGAETTQVQEIVNYQEVTTIPQMPDFIEGIVNLRGRVIPIVNLNKRFNLGSSEKTNKQKIIITKANNVLIGYMVDEVSEIIKFHRDDMEPASEVITKVGNSYIKCVGKKEDKLILILELSKILSQNEQEKLTENN